MAITATDVQGLAGETAVERGAGARARRFVRRQPTLVLGLGVLLIVLVSGVLAPVWWTGDPMQMKPA
ncbi:MAG TPA: hypothetical protein VIX41_09115, partial [Acidimicrobiales bacterium]